MTIAVAEARRRMSAARRRARDGRPGADSPDTVIRQLDWSLSSAHAVIAEHLAEPSPGPHAVIDFAREIVRTAGQLLEYAQDYPVLPDPSSDGFLTEEATRHYRRRIAGIASDWASFLRRSISSNETPMLAAVDVESAALALTARFHAATEDERSGLKREAYALLSRTETLLRSAASDPEELLPWVQASMYRILVTGGDPTWVGALLNASRDLADRDVAWQLMLAQLQYCAEQPDPASTVAAFEAFVDEIGGWPTKKAVGASVYALAPVQNAAAALLEMGLIVQAQQVILALLRLSGQESASGVSRLVTFLGGPNVFGLIVDETEPKVVRAPIQVQTMLDLVAASLDEKGSSRSSVDLGRVRKSLSAQLSPITRNPAVLDVQPVEVDPIGFTSWIPWHGLTSVGGDTFAHAAGMRWKHPMRHRAPLPHQPLLNGTFIIDRSIRGSAALVRVWSRAAHEHGGRVVEFDSSDESDDAHRLLEAVADTSHIVYFGHAVSDPDARMESGLVTGPDELLHTDLLRNADLGGVESAVLVACEGGRSQPFLPATSPAHALASAGVRTVVATLWPILVSDGDRYLRRYLDMATADPSLSTHQLWARAIGSVQRHTLPFSCMSSDTPQPSA